MDYFRKNDWIQEANDILNNGWHDIGGYGVIKLDDEIPWHMENEQQRSWNFRLHSWDMLESLLNGYDKTHDTRFLKPAIRIAVDWVDKHSNTAANTDISPFAWYDMAVGIRANRLAHIIDAGTQSGLLDSQAREILWLSLMLHHTYLSNDANILFHNNHGFFQITGQIQMGRRLAEESPLMKQALEQGKARLHLILKRQFASDGIHLEHSPYYFREVYETLKVMVDSGVIDDAETLAFIKKIEITLSWFVLPNGDLANFGDSDCESLLCEPTEAEWRWRTPEMRYVVSAGKTGTPPSARIAVFPEGGYFIVRKSHQGKPNDFCKSSYLAQIAAFHSRTHKQADDLSFIWSDKGNSILIDAGRYGYIGRTEVNSELWQDGHWYSDENRVYCESTRAHNTLEFDGKNYQRKGVKPYGSALGRYVEDASGVIALETVCKHFRSIKRCRVLIFKPGTWLIVFDWYGDTSKKPHQVRQWFHFAPSLEVNLDDNGYLIQLPENGELLLLKPLLDHMTPSRIYCGETSEPMQGWFSPAEREIVPSPACCYEQTGQTTGVLASLFSFSSNLIPDPVWSTVNVTGRNARFRWQDDDGRHTLTLNRQENQPLELNYSVE